MLILHALRRLLFGDRAALKKLACRYSFNYGASLAQLSNEVANIPKLLRFAMYNFSNKTCCDVSQSTRPHFKAVSASVAFAVYKFLLMRLKIKVIPCTQYDSPACARVDIFGINFSEIYPRLFRTFLPQNLLVSSKMRHRRHVALRVL